MSFAEKWAVIDADHSGAQNPMDRMDTMDTIQSGGNSVHCVHIVHSIPTPKKGEVIPRTGLDDWLEFPPEGCDFAAYEAAGSLLDLCRRQGLRLTREGETFRVRYPLGAPPTLTAYGDLLLAEAMPFIRENMEVRQ